MIHFKKQHTPLIQQAVGSIDFLITLSKYNYSLHHSKTSLSLAIWITRATAIVNHAFVFMH